MPIYNGNTKVSLSGIKAAYVGNTKVMSSGAWHTIWSGTWSVKTEQFSAGWYEKSYKTISEGSTSSTKFRITYTLSVGSGYGNLSGNVSSNSQTLHSISGGKSWSGSFTDEVEVYGGAFDPNVTTLHRVASDTFTNTIMLAACSEDQYHFNSRLCVFVKPDLTRISVCVTANNSSAPSITIGISKIEQFY